jgi:poly(3-hydroxybutyrate) depolymerase
VALGGVGLVARPPGGHLARTAGGAVGHAATRIWPISYVAHDGSSRGAYVLLPSWYGPHHNPPIPLVISPHGRGVSGLRNTRLWGNLPAIGGFAVVSPDGQGRLLSDYSWGDPGQVNDLARMPLLVRRALPWVRIRASRVYAFGGSMGGQETLLLVARHPRLLAGAAAFDSVANLALQYRHYPELPCNRLCRARWGEPIGLGLQALARREIGGNPTADPAAYAARSPLHFAPAIARSDVPLQLWWSTRDRIVPDQTEQSARLFRTIKRINPEAPITEHVGTWRHTHEMRSTTKLPTALARFGLLPEPPTNPVQTANGRTTGGLSD